MYVKSVKVQNQVGLHARPATFFIQKANEFKSSIWVERMSAESMRNLFSASFLSVSWVAPKSRSWPAALTRKRLSTHL